MTNKYCDCQKPCIDCIEANWCDICDKPINVEEINEDNRMLKTLKRELGLLKWKF